MKHVSLKKVFLIGISALLILCALLLCSCDKKKNLVDDIQGFTCKCKDANSEWKNGACMKKTAPTSATNPNDVMTLCKIKYNGDYDPDKKDCKCPATDDGKCEQWKQSLKPDMAGVNCAASGGNMIGDTCVCPANKTLKDGKCVAKSKNTNSSTPTETNKKKTTASGSNNKKIIWPVTCNRKTLNSIADATTAADIRCLTVLLDADTKCDEAMSPNSGMLSMQSACDPKTKKCAHYCQNMDASSLLSKQTEFTTICCDINSSDTVNCKIGKKKTVQGRQPTPSLSDCN